MSKRTSNTQNELESADPQESLIKSLESIKTLLKQGDSKINEARENIARADKIHSNTKDELTLNNTSLKSETKTNQTVIGSNIAVTAEANIKSTKPAGLIAETMNVKTININNKKSKDAIADSRQNIKQTNKSESTTLNDLYDHDLIVPMLDEIIEPENQDSGLFNMNSSIELNANTETNSSPFELDNNKLINEQAELPELTEALTSNYKPITKSNSRHSIGDANADIITFDLNSNNNKKNNKTIDNDLTVEMPNISLIEEPTEENKNYNEQSTKPALTEHVIIKETTIEKPVTMKPATHLGDSEDSMYLKSSLTTDSSNEIISAQENVDLTPAIDTAHYTDNILNRLNDSSDNDINDESGEFIEDDFSKIDGLNKLNFNSRKISALEKRVEKRVHNRLIQIIVQLDEDIKKIFTDEIKKCVEIEINELDKDK